MYTWQMYLVQAERESDVYLVERALLLLLEVVHLLLHAFDRRLQRLQLLPQGVLLALQGCSTERNEFRHMRREWETSHSKDDLTAVSTSNVFSSCPKASCSGYSIRGKDLKIWGN